MCEYTLSSLTDWTSLYCRLALLSLSDPAFHTVNFHRLPVGLLRAMLDHASSERKQLLNAQSISTAKLGMVVLGAVGGKNSKAKVEDFLPYELEKSGLSVAASTKECIEWALKSRKLPSVIVGLIAPEIG